jgi:D-alanyl-D-alanine carboxypeptidase (penicillin-binding protein 5/6)
VVGKVDLTLDGKVVDSVDLVTLEAVEEAGLFRRLWDSIRLFFFQLLN